MQPKLRMISFFAAALLWASLISAATQGATAHTATQKPTLHPFGVASWYGAQHQGRKMANGQRFDQRKLTAASWTLPLGTTIRVVNVQNGRNVVVTVTDRGPNRRLHRVLDLSRAAAEQLDYIDRGLAPVFYSLVSIAQAQDMPIESPLIAPASNELIAVAGSAEPSLSTR